MQARFETSTDYSLGVSTKETQQHLYIKFPEIKAHQISNTTIRDLFEQSNCANISHVTKSLHQDGGGCLLH